MFNPTVRWTLGLGLALSVVLPAATAKAQQKIAIVDIRRAIEDSNEGKANIGGPEGRSRPQAEGTSAKQDELKKLKRTSLKQSVLQPAAAQKKREELRQKVMQLQDAPAGPAGHRAKEAKVLQPLKTSAARD